MRQREQHQRAHPVQLVADVLPMPGGGVSGIEQVESVELSTRKLREIPRRVVRARAEEAVPAFGFRIVGSFHGEHSAEVCERGSSRIRFAYRRSSISPTGFPSGSRRKPIHNS